MENCIDLAFKLHDLLLNSDEYLSLKHYEKIMFDDFHSSSLINDYKQLQEKYMNIKTKQMLQKLHQAKLKMDQDINVINYRKAYKEYMILVGNITDIAFKDFSNNSIIDKIIRAN